VKKTVEILDVDYRIQEDKPLLRLFCRSEDGEKVVCTDRDFRPYFYVIPRSLDECKEQIRQKEFRKNGESLKVLEVEERTLEDSNEDIDVLKVTAEVPPEVPKLREQMTKLESVKKCREFDIPFYKRYLIDKDILPVARVTLDLERDEEFDYRVEEVLKTEEESEGGYETLAFDLEVFNDKVRMASFKAENFEKLLTTAEIDKEYVETVESEKELIERFKEIIEDQKAEIITGYNTDEFDFRILRERARENDLALDIGLLNEKVKFERRGRFSSARVKGRMHLDLYPFIAHIMSPGLDSERLDLDSVAEEFLGRNKDDIEFEKMKESWDEKENLEELADYALKDSVLAYELGKEIIPQIFELSRITGLIPFDACRLTYGQLTENFLLREAYRREKLSPNRPSREERRKRRREGAYEGGFVYSPEPGLYEDIALLDFKSLYPTVMVSHNISPDTLEVKGCDDVFQLEEFDYEFCQDFQGFFPELIESLITERTELKQRIADLEESSSEHKSMDSRQRALKVLANSFYGYLGYEGARWYSRESAEATTYLGRKYIQDAVEEAEEKGFEVVYGDTDSLFQRKDDLKDSIDDFLQEVNDELPSFMKLELEGFFKRGFFTSTDSGEGAKKKYALLSENGEMKITGFEYVRRDWSQIAKETQKRVIRKVLEGKPEQASELVKDTVERLKQGEVDTEKLEIFTELTKKPENYDSTAPHVEAAKKAIRRGEDIGPGDTVAYVITRGGGSISDRAEISKYADSYDSEYYIDSQVLPVSIRVLKVFGYTAEQLKGKGKQSGLGKFS